MSSHAKLRLEINTVLILEFIINKQSYEFSYCISHIGRGIGNMSNNLSKHSPASLLRLTHVATHDSVTLKLILNCVPSE